MDAEGWENHCRAGHLPYRRDCHICVEAAGRDRPRKRVPCPESFCMGIDMTGPFEAGRDQEVNKPRYAMVATVTIPVDADGPLISGLQSLRAERAVIAADEEVWVPEEDGDGGSPGESGGQLPEQPEHDLEQGDGDDLAAMARKEEAWKAFLKDAKAADVRTLVLAIPVKDRKAGTVIEATATLVARLRALQIPILHIHTDRAKEFVGRRFREWVAARGIYQTCTAGDEPAGNARTERAIGLVKARARTLLAAAGAPMELWPLAVRQAGEELFRRQLRNLGVPAPPMLVKKKTWHCRGRHGRSQWRRLECGVRRPTCPLPHRGTMCSASMAASS